MKKCVYLMIFFLLIVLGFSGQATAETKSYFYETHTKTGQLKDKFHLTIDKLPSGETKYSREIAKNGTEESEESILNESFETVGWSRKRTDGKTNYTGVKEENVLTLTGKMKGKGRINRTIKLDGKPFYYTPKFNLTHFVLSDAQEITFWMLRKDLLTKYLMQAKKVGEEKITVGDKKYKAVKVYYSATGIGEKYYNRTYYFRKSDGLFIKKENPKGTTTELVDKK